MYHFYIQKNGDNDVYWEEYGVTNHIKIIFITYHNSRFFCEYLVIMRFDYAYDLTV